MKKKATLPIIASVLFFASCDGQLANNRVSFDDAFPKSNKDLTAVLGKSLQLKSNSDTLHLTISSDKQANLITEAYSGDTIFYGKVSKYRGLYYFSQAINDSSYQIYAVKIADNLIYGLNSAWIQNVFIEHEVKQGKLAQLVKYIAPDSSLFRLHPHKREFKKVYSKIVEKLEPDTILYLNHDSHKPEFITAASFTDPEENELYEKAYPNPFKDIINIKLQQHVNFQLVNLSGKIILTGKLDETASKISTGNLAKGTYILTLSRQNSNLRESIKLVKE